MAAQIEVIEERLKSLLYQLQAEYGILDRIVYKNKNQHRRCSYFQYLLKVRRDLKLLQSGHLEELLDSCFNVFSGKKAKHKVHLLESLKKRCDSGKVNFLERLLGAARLLSEMVEPMLKAAVEISTLLARSFFMGFSLMILALLARLRVLVQQILLDVVSVYNEVSSLAQKKQSIKITQDGIEVFREYYPTIEEIVTLDCVWRTDKFVLVETSSKCDLKNQEGSLETGRTLRPCVRYQSIKAFLKDDCSDSEKSDGNIDVQDSVSNSKRKRSESPVNFSNETSGIQHIQNPSMLKNNLEDAMPRGQNIITEGLASSSGSLTSSSSQPSSTSNKRVAFISVTKPTTASSNTAVFKENEFKSKLLNDEENPLFNLLHEEETKGSIF